MVGRFIAWSRDHYSTSCVLILTVRNDNLNQTNEICFYNCPQQAVHRGKMTVANFCEGIFLVQAKGDHVWCQLQILKPYFNYLFLLSSCVYMAKPK